MSWNNVWKGNNLYSNDTVRNFITNVKMNHISNLLNQNYKFQNIVEIGCGDGKMLFELSKIGLKYKKEDNQVTFLKSDLNNDSIVFETYNDHRIFMSLAILSIIVSNDTFIKGEGAVNKSYPNFIEVLKELNVIIK